MVWPDWAILDEPAIIHTPRQYAIVLSESGIGYRYRDRDARTIAMRIKHKYDADAHADSRISIHNTRLLYPRNTSKNWPAPRRGVSYYLSTPTQTLTPQRKTHITPLIHATGRGMKSMHGL